MWVAGGALVVVGTASVVLVRRKKIAKSGKAKALPPASLPPEVLEGGVPIEKPWHTVGWYTYPEGQFWIRIDEYGDAVFKADDSVSLDSITGKQTATITGRWRWTVIAGQATPLATGQTEYGTYTLTKRSFAGWDRQEAEDAMADRAAKAASEWIDTAYSLT